MKSNGFTLIELMVSLMIFGMLAAAGVGVLRFSVDAQSATKGRLDMLAKERRIESLMTADAGQAVPRVTRNDAGDPVQAFDGDGAGFTLVRAGVDPMADSARSSLQKVQYRVEGRRLHRTAWPMLDGAAPGQPAVMVDEIESATFQYRSKDGWRAVWDPLRPDLLPRAIELVVRPVRGPQMRYLFLVGAGA